MLHDQLVKQCDAFGDTVHTNTISKDNIYRVILFDTSTLQTGIRGRNEIFLVTDPKSALH
jgi:hypothetical protein